MGERALRPRVGITVSQIREPNFGRVLQSTPAFYPRAVLAAGGLPVLLPVLPGTEAEQLGGFDALLLSGGVDVDPEYFGAAHEAGLGEVDPERDQFELEVYRLARAAAKPVLGICRGFQLINVAEGGTLHQHLPSAQGIWADHAQTARAPTLGHRVQLSAGSRLAEAFAASSVRVNSYHHQGVRDVAPGLTVSAWAPDGLVEALEAPGVTAVQWHPEMLFEQHPEHLLPFRMLVEACREAAPAWR